MTSNSFTSDDGPLKLHCIGVQFGTESAETRDALALSPSQVSEALATISVVLPSAEAVVLATCNRTELYVVEAGDPERLDLWHRTVGHRAASDAACPAEAAGRFHHTGAAAADHLFRVVSGLESADLGDSEIAGQVRRARELGVDAGTVGTILHKLFDVAAQTGRRARRETLISVGGSGIGPMTAREVAERAPERPVVTVLGAGVAAEAVCRELRKRTGASLRIVNRTVRRAETLADRHGGQAHGFDSLVPALRGADVVVTALRGEHPVLDRDMVAAVRALDDRWSPLVVDTCVPRMVGPDVDLEVVHLDELAARHDEIHRIRADAVPAVEQIVDEAVEQFSVWLRERALRDVIAELYREADRLTGEAAVLVSDERAARELHRAVRRLVHQHITRLRALEDPTVAPARKEAEG